MFAFRSPLKTGVMAACAAAALGFAVPAAAQDPLFAQFQAVCAAGDGSAAKAAAAVEADGGWMALDPAMLGPDAPFDNMQAWMKMADGGFRLVMTGDMTEDMGGMGAMNMSVCAVGGQPADAAAIEAETKVWTGASAPLPEMDTDKFRGYGFMLENGRRTPISADVTEDALGMQMMTGNMRLVMIGEENDVTMIMYMEPKMQ